jgi:hypothetical protein
MAIVLSVCVSGLPSLLLPVDWSAKPRIFTWMLAFGTTGFFWMLLEGQTPPHNLASWGLKLARGLVFWGILLSVLLWNLPIIFRINTYSGFDYELPLTFVFSLFAGLILSFVLASYSFFFIKRDKPSAK